MGAFDTGKATVNNGYNIELFLLTLLHTHVQTCMCSLSYSCLPACCYTSCTPHLWWYCEGGLIDLFFSGEKAVASGTGSWSGDHNLK